MIKKAAHFVKLSLLLYMVVVWMGLCDYHFGYLQWEHSLAWLNPFLSASNWKSILLFYP